jgi:stringent starvation protein B
MITSKKPYLIMAMYEWIVDNNFTPYIMVNAEFPNVVIPQKYVKNGLIIFNISSLAAKDLKINKEEVLFETKFEGRAFDISFPTEAVISIFARENGRGMVFTPDFDKQTGVDLTPPKPRPTKPHLTLIKNTD